MKKLFLASVLGCIGTQASPTVTVCIDQLPDAFVVERAKMIATKMFAPIGVPLEWHGDANCPHGRIETIRIHLTNETPRDYLPGALAYAQPFERTHVRVFYDRVRSLVNPKAVPVSSVLAHVLVHEITHILQGTDQHSASGVMMAHWGAAEYHQMAMSSLAFTESDVVSIHNGLAGWNSVGARGASEPMPAVSLGIGPDKPHRKLAGLSPYPERGRLRMSRDRGHLIR